MNFKVLTIITLLVVFISCDKSRIRKLTEANLEAFSKDNSYWLIQISGIFFMRYRGKMPRMWPT